MRKKRYNSRHYMNFRERLLLWLALAFASGVCAHGAMSLKDESRPAAELAKQIAAISGPGPARIIVQNRSSLTAEETIQIRKLLERDLRGLGVISQAGESGESATTIRITLSTNAGGGLWVAEVREGTEVHVAMVPVDLGPPAATQSESGILLSKAFLWRQKEPVLDLIVIASETSRRMIVLEPERIVSYLSPNGDANSWTREQEFPISHARPMPRDARGLLVPGTGEHLFDAYLPGVQCHGEEQERKLAVACEDGDDPWPLPGSASLAANPEPDSAETRHDIKPKAFYNSTRNYFTGVLSPAASLRLPAFYQAAAIVQPAGASVVLTGIDGRAVMVENGAIRSVAGTRDWGSDLAAVRSGCGSGTQLLASASGADAADSLRAYEIDGRNALPVSSPLEMPGAITAIWPSSDDRDATVVVRKTGSAQTASRQALGEDYEVYRVSAHCS